MTLKHETINVDDETVRCDGLSLQISYERHGQAGAHPVVSLKINKDNQVDCPYCGRTFCYKEKDKEPTA